MKARKLSRPEPEAAGSIDSRNRNAPPLAVPEVVLSACRAASLRIGTPALSNLGITSALRGEGRTSIAIAMAAVHREDFGRSVVLVDFDLEVPTLSRRLRANPVPGLCEVVRGECALPDAIQRIADGVSFVPAGVVSGSVARTVTEAGRRELVACIEREAGLVIADLPPLLASSSGRSAAALFGDLLLVVRAGVTPVARAREATNNLPVEPAVLLNGTESRLPRWMKRIIGA
jgi:MinD-like ATPase involved in chromosome partitioning or flagellar assembly